MLIRRCAWHLKYHGYRILFGIASWRGFRLRFTDGLCRRCVARHRAEWRSAHGVTESAPRVRVGRVAVIVFALAGLVLAARPLDHGTALMSLVPIASRPVIPSASLDAAEEFAAPSRRAPRTALRAVPRAPVQTRSVATANRGRGHAAGLAVLRAGATMTPPSSMVARPSSPRPLHLPVLDAGSSIQAP